MFSRFSQMLALCAALTVVAVPVAMAGGDSERGKDDRRSAVNRLFLTAAAQGNLFEIRSGRLATDRGESEGVNALGAMLVSDHKAELGRIRLLASRLGVRLPEAPNAKQRAQIKALAGTSAGFDAAFLAAQRTAHVESIALYRTAALKGGRAVRVDAVNALPVLGMHLGEVLRMQGGN